mgnify:CR=1 FL=1
MHDGESCVVFVGDIGGSSFEGRIILERRGFQRELIFSAAAFLFIWESWVRMPACSRRSSCEWWEVVVRILILFQATVWPVVRAWWAGGNVWAVLSVPFTESSFMFISQWICLYSTELVNIYRKVSVECQQCYRKVSVEYQRSCRGDSHLGLVPLQYLPLLLHHNPHPYEPPSWRVGCVRGCVRRCVRGVCKKVCTV